MTDQELLRAYARSRDTESLGAFFGRYEESLVRFAGKLLGDFDRAQDVVQETFLKVANNPTGLFGVESCHNWLLRVVHNLGVSQLRRDARVRRHAPRVAERVEGLAAERREEAAVAVEREEVRERVRNEIRKLSPRHRELLLLKVEEQKSYREIAEITGLTVTNVGYLLHQAMKELTRRLERSKEDLL